MRKQKDVGLSLDYLRCLSDADKKLTQQLSFCYASLENGQLTTRYAVSSKGKGF